MSDFLRRQYGNDASKIPRSRGFCKALCDASKTYKAELEPECQNEAATRKRDIEMSERKKQIQAKRAKNEKELYL